MIIIYSSRNLICIAHKYREILFCCHACCAAGRLLLYAVKAKNRTSMHPISHAFGNPGMNTESSQSRTDMNFSPVWIWMRVLSWQKIDGRRLLFPPIPNEGCALTLNQSIFTLLERERRQDRESIDELAVRCRIDFLCHATFFFATVFH